MVTNLFLELRDPLIDYLSTQVAPKEKKESLEKLALIHSVFRRELPQEYNVERITLLMQRIAFGEEKKAQEVLELFPNLLLNRRGAVIDYSGRKIKNLTPFEATIAAGDTNMLYMMAPYFHRLKRGREIMQWQFKQIFPDKKGQSRIFPDAEGGLEGHLKRQKENVFDFDAIIAAFQRATPAEENAARSKEGARFMETDDARPKSNAQLTLTEALNRFREQFTQKSHHEIVFNPQHLLRAFKVFMNNFYGWGSDKAAIFWHQVIGFVQRFLPACDAQAYAQGLYYYVENNEPLHRSFEMRGFNGLFFYPPDLTTISTTSHQLGFDFGGGDFSDFYGTGNRKPHTVFTKFISSKNTQLRELMRVSPESATWCVIS